MKTAFVAFLALAIGVTGVFAGGVQKGGADPLCGTWYGGSDNPDHAGYKYQYSFVPTGPDRWFVLA
jgi:hypothetical protein